LTSLYFQTLGRFRIVISDQSETTDLSESGEIRAVVRLLESSGREVAPMKNLPRRGLAHQRQFLLDAAVAPYALFLDDDLILEKEVLERLLRAIRQEGCGFVGAAVIGLSFLGDVRPHEQAVELWNGPVRPETIAPKSREWERYKLHNAANLHHVQERLVDGSREYIPYKVAWVGGCVMYDVDKLRSVGGFDFWSALPTNHCGEDVLAQHRVMGRYGGCGVMPSGVYHQELPTTVEDRTVNAPEALPYGSPF
jgi:GT2 family glycosyltransferase